jgi:signal transduction histidine kinase
MVNLARLLRETVADLQPAFDANGRSVVVDAPERLEVHAEARGLRDVIEALIDNALCHGAGVVTVRLESRRDWRILTVEDEGPGVDADLWERVFERFQKLDPNSHGAGLGLAIVRQTARSLGGDARLIGAAAVEVVLPRPVAETGAAGRS